MGHNDYIFLFGLTIFASALGGMLVAILNMLRRAKLKKSFNNNDIHNECEDCSGSGPDAPLDHISTHPWDSGTIA